MRIGENIKPRRETNRTKESSKPLKLKLGDISSARDALVNLKRNLELLTATTS